MMNLESLHTVCLRPSTRKRITMKKLMFAAMVLGVAAGANAQFVIRGTFNDWGNLGDVTMTDMGGGHWQGTVTGLTAGDRHEFKVTTTDWGNNGPNQNARFVVGASGEVLINFWENASADGWMPNSGKRVGYWGGDTHGWEVMGSFNGWSSPVALTHMGGGLYEGELAMTAGTYEYKFRKEGDWDVAIGYDFSNYDNNILFDVLSDGLYKFSLDLPNGRHNLTEVPEPASMAVLGLGVAAMIRRRSRKA